MSHCPSDSLVLLALTYFLTTCYRTCGSVSSCFNITNIYFSVQTSNPTSSPNLSVQPFRPIWESDQFRQSSCPEHFVSQSVQPKTRKLKTKLLFGGGMEIIVLLLHHLRMFEIWGSLGKVAEIWTETKIKEEGRFLHKSERKLLLWLFVQISPWESTFCPDWTSTSPPTSLLLSWSWPSSSSS